MDVIDVLPALQSRVQVYAARRGGEGGRGASQNDPPGGNFVGFCVRGCGFGMREGGMVERNARS